MKKTFFLGLLAFLSFSCNQDKAEKGSQVHLPEAKVPVDANQPHWKSYQEKAELTWFVNFDWFAAGDGSDLLVKEIERRTGTKIIFTKGDDDRFNQMIASGQLPDIITMNAGSNQFSNSAERWAVPLNQLADAYDPYFYQVVEPDTVAWYTNDAGDIYGYPSYSNGAKHYFEEDWLLGTNAFVVRQDIYEAIGSPDMRNPDGFLQALRAARAYDPSVIPLTGTNMIEGNSFGESMMDFLAIPKVVDYQRNERLYDDEYLIWMDIIRQAYQEGLIPDDEFARTGDHFEDYLAQGKYFAMILDGVPNRSGTLIRNYNRNPKQAYIAIDAISNTQGDAPRLTQTGIGGWTQTYVTKDAKDKERAIALITFMISEEGQILQNFGIEGETFFIDAEGFYQLTPDALALRTSDNDRFKRELRIGELWMLGHDSFYQKNLKEHPQAMIQINQWLAGKAYPNFLLENTDPPARTEEDRIKVNRNREYDTLLVNMLRAKSKEEMLALVDTYKQAMKSINFEKYEAYVNAKIATNAKRLQM